MIEILQNIGTALFMCLCLWITAIIFLYINKLIEKYIIRKDKEETRIDIHGKKKTN